MPAGLVAIGLFWLLAANDGGYAPTVWYPCTVAMLALVCAVAPRNVRRVSRPVGISLVALGAFCAWSFASIAWAQVPGDAWDGANRTLLYLAVYVVFVLPSWRARDAALLIGLFAVGIAAIGGVAFFRSGASAFVDHRLAAPTGYANASAALFLGALPPAVALAARREVPVLLRALSLAAAGVLAQLAVLAQSRGSVPAVALAVAVLLILSPEWRRCLVVLVPVAATTLASLKFLLQVYVAHDDLAAGRAIASERTAMAVSAATLALFGVVLSRLDEHGVRMRMPSGLSRPRAAIAAGVASLVVAGLVAAAPFATARDALGSTSEYASSRFTGGFESGRYHLWRIAIRELVDHPLTGVGADNFAVDLAHEDGADHLLYPHSSILRAFSQTGLVGGMLFLGFVAAAIVALIRVRGQDSFHGAVIAGAAAAFAYWLAHSAADWLWEIPALTAPAFAWLGLAVSTRTRASERGVPVRRVGRLTAAVAALAVVSCALPALAAFQIERAATEGIRRPQRAFALLNRARYFNPLSERPDIVAGVLAQRSGDFVRARAAFARASRRSPDDWWIRAELALLDVRSGRRAEARAQLRSTQALAPRSPVVRTVARAVHSGKAGIARSALAELDRQAIRSPLGRRPLECRPVLGLAGHCTVARGAG